MQVRCATSPMPNYEYRLLFKLETFYSFPEIQIFEKLERCRNQYHQQSKKELWKIFNVRFTHQQYPEKIG